jgi:ADP-heptose:LPS heptosyltransferase
VLNPKALLLKLLARRRYRGDIDPARLRRILIVRPAKIGDTLCMYPLIRELKRALPQARVDVYAGVHNNFLFRYLPQVERVYTKYRNRHWPKTLREVLRMRRNRYDLVIDTMDIKFGKVLSLVLINPAWLIGSSGFESRYGIRNADLKFYDYLIPWQEIHTTDRLLGFLRPLGIDYESSAMEFPLGEDSIAFAEAFLAPYTGRYLIGLNAEASDIVRSINDDEIIGICRGIVHTQDNVVIILFSSPHRREHANTLIAAAGLVHVVPEKGSRNIFDAAALVSRLDVMISPNTSFIHIASAFDIPTVGIYHNDKHHLQAWSPRSSRSCVITPPGNGDDVRGFSIEQTVEAAVSFLNERDCIKKSGDTLI